MTTEAVPETYDVCLSFAGEDREYVEGVAAELKRLNVKVFYDRYEEAWLWGKDLYQHLDDIYRNKARFCLIFVSAAYAKKLWTKRELASAQARALRENEYVLPVRLDDTEVPGLTPTVAYINGRERSPEQLAALVGMKLGVVASERTGEPRRSFRENRVVRRSAAALVAFITIVALYYGIKIAGGSTTRANIPSQMVNLPLPDPDGRVTAYTGAVRINVPRSSGVRVSVGLARWVEFAVLVRDESGTLYQKWGTAIHHNWETQRTLQPGKTYYISSWRKEVADNGHDLPWYPAIQRFDATINRVTSFHDPANPEADAFIDIGLVPGQAK